MKTTLKTLAIVTVAASLAFAGCKKEKIEPLTPETPEVETPENNYVGTAWSAHLENTYYYEGMLQMDVTYDLSLDFLDSVSGELFHDLVINVPDYPAASQNQNMTEAFTYTFSNDSVILKCHYYDDELGDTAYYSYELVYDTVAQTLTLDFDDPDMEEIMGTSVMVFTQVPVEPAKAIIPSAKTAKGKMSWGNIVGRIVRALKI
ncbi:MAG: hypothetical protein IK126_00570 [Bacteroidales bacterium]|nr:hypothetical protein [Bacteroidales bacterium]